MAARTLIPKRAFSRIFSPRILRPNFLLRPLTDSSFLRLPIAPSSGGASFSTSPGTSSLNDPSPYLSNRPPDDSILLDGCDFEHWFVVLEPPDASLTRDQIIDSYIKTLTEVLGSEEEAKKSIYSVSTKHYFAFGCTVSEELSYKIKTLPKVRWVIPDSYLDCKNKDYGGEPFIDGKAVPYDPKYHEGWAQNHARANERFRGNDKPDNFTRSRNFESRRENMQNFQNGEAPPMPNQGFQASPPPPPPPHNGTTPLPPQNATSPPPPHNATLPKPTHNATTPLPPQNATFPPPRPPNVQSQTADPSSYQGVGSADPSSYQGVGSGAVPSQTGGPSSYQGGAGPKLSNRWASWARLSRKPQLSGRRPILSV